MLAAGLHQRPAPARQQRVHAVQVQQRLGLLAARVGEGDDIGPQPGLMQRDQQRRRVDAGTEAQDHQTSQQRGAQPQHLLGSQDRNRAGRRWCRCVHGGAREGDGIDAPGRALPFKPAASAHSAVPARMCMRRLRRGLARGRRRAPYWPGPRGPSVASLARRGICCPCAAALAVETRPCIRPDQRDLRASHGATTARPAQQGHPPIGRLSRLD